MNSFTLDRDTPMMMTKRLPSGVFITRWTTLTVPTSYRSVGAGESTRLSRWVNTTSIPSLCWTSLISLTELSRPTVSGITAFGKITASRTGSIGSCSGMVWIFCCMSSSCSKSRFMSHPEKTACYDPRVSGEKRFQWTVALILFGVLFFGVSDTQLVAPLLPLIAKDLGTTPGHAGIIVTTYSLAAAAFALFVGPLSDRVGRKKVLVSGLALFTLASFLTYHVSTFNALVILRAMTGFAAGTLSTSALSFAGDYYPYEQRGRAMGILSMSYFAAFVIGIPVLSLVASRVGWHWVFGCLSAGAGVMFVIAFLRLPSQAAHPRPARQRSGFIDH